MRLYLAALVFACVACGGSPTEPSHGQTLVTQQQGWLCSSTASGGFLLSCKSRNFTEDLRRVSFTIARPGTLEIDVTFRGFDYNEYIRPVLRCNAAPLPLTLTRQQFGLTSPDWFRAHLGELWPGQAMSLTAAADRKCAYEFDLAFDLRSPPYSPFDLTIRLQY
jgi:hypothetical protein